MYLHVLGDTAGTLVVAAGGGLVWGMNRPVYAVVDPICTLVFACLVCATTYPFLVDLVWVLLESAPKGVDASQARGESGGGGQGGEIVMGVHSLGPSIHTPPQLRALTRLIYRSQTNKKHVFPSVMPQVERKRVMCE